VAIVGLFTLAVTVHNRLAADSASTVAIAIVVVTVALLASGVFDRNRRSQRAMANLAHKIEAKPGVVVLLRGSGSTRPLRDLKRILREDEHQRLPVVRLNRTGISAKTLFDALKKRLEEDERPVVRLDGSHFADASSGRAEEAVPYSRECLKILSQIGWALQAAPGLSEQEKEIAAELHGFVSYCLQQNSPPDQDQLRDYVVKRVRAYGSLKDRLVLLAYARQESLQRPTGKWLLDLLVQLPCTFGFLTQDGEPPPPPEDNIGWPEARLYADRLPLPEQQVDNIMPALRSVAVDPPGVNLRLLKIRCAVLAVAADLDRQAEAIERLVPPVSPELDDLLVAAVLEVRWLFDCKTARTGVLDRLAAVGEVTPEMLTALLRDLEPDANAASSLYSWLRDEEFRQAGIIVTTEDSISLSKTISGPVLTWLDKNDKPALRAARVAAERCYRECLILDPAHVPGDRHIDWLADGYGGLTLFEDIGWLEAVGDWASQIAALQSPDDRRDARVAITCLFLEAWWWWGDQVRHPSVVQLLFLAGRFKPDEPEWFAALDEFNDNYQPEFDRREGAAAQWQHVAHALEFLGTSLGLQPGNIPADGVLARIYICWCVFNGDAARYTGDLQAADRWLGQAVEACGDDADKQAMRAFTNYQRADLWIPSDTDRSLRLITETHLAEEAVSLDDVSLQGYTSRMHGDIRWKAGNIDGAFDAYARALLFSYVFQVDQESPKMPPTEYTYRLYNEMRTRFLARISEARGQGLNSAADAAIKRTAKLFVPYWAVAGTATASRDDPLDGIAPPLPPTKDLASGSEYAQRARDLEDQLLANAQA
jgi:hypothetical protein